MDKTEIKFKWKYDKERVKTKQLRAEIRELQRELRHHKETLDITQKAHWRATEAWAKAEERLNSLA